METNLLTFQFLLKCYHNNIGSVYSFNFYTEQTFTILYSEFFFIYCLIMILIVSTSNVFFNYLIILLIKLLMCSVIVI